MGDRASESVKNPPIQPVEFRIRKIRMKKEDSAFVYFVFEACEGICSYSTLPFKTGDAHRDMILRIPPDFEEDVQEVLNQLGDKVYELEP